jgi:hypothetical protein
MCGVQDSQRPPKTVCDEWLLGETMLLTLLARKIKFMCLCLREKRAVYVMQWIQINAVLNTLTFSDSRYNHILGEE